MTQAAAAEDTPGLENFIQVSARIYSGGEPQGETAFHTLAGLGVRTIVSTDGSKPDIDAARVHGIRYVHIPIGYDGIEPAAQAAMAKTLAEREGPFYVHCHHGKHRGPAMAAIAWLFDEGVPKDQARAFMERAKTSPDYAGLWQTVDAFDPAKLDGIDAELHETAPVASLVSEMAAISRIAERLGQSKDASWQTPAGHDDILPAHEATILAERFRELVRLGGDEAMNTEMRLSEQLAWTLKDALESKDPQTATRTFTLLRQSCKSCHDNHRNGFALSPE